METAGGLTECPYFYRYILDFGMFSIRLHHWLSDDDHRAYHDHPYWFWTFVLKGSYVDVSPTIQEWNGGPREFRKIDLVRRWQWRFRQAEYKHSVQTVEPNTWTFLITGKPSRRWAFWVDGKRIMRDKYFAVFGHHPCDPVDEPVRQKPDGVRI
jgi:hypothetical protein